MQVIFNNSGGTINSGTMSGQSFTPGAIAVPWARVSSTATGNDNFNIQGKFGSDGLLYGTVKALTDEETAPLTGLIGVNGAVGAFANIAQVSQGGNFSGGFVAKP